MGECARPTGVPFSVKLMEEMGSGEPTPALLSALLEPHLPVPAQHVSLGAASAAFTRNLSVVWHLVHWPAYTPLARLSLGSRLQGEAGRQQGGRQTGSRTSDTPAYPWVAVKCVLNRNEPSTRNNKTHRAMHRATATCTSQSCRPPR